MRCWQVAASLVSFFPILLCGRVRNWFDSPSDGGPCRSIFLNGQKPYGFGQATIQVEHTCQCFRSECIYVAILRKKRHIPVYWAISVQVEWPSSNSIVDFVDMISNWYTDPWAVSSIMRKQRSLSFQKTGTNVNGRTHIVSGVITSESGKRHTGGLDNQPNVLFWSAYHYSAASKVFKGAIIKKHDKIGSVQITLKRLEKILGDAYATAVPVKIFDISPGTESGTHSRRKHGQRKCQSNNQHKTELILEKGNSEHSSFKPPKYAVQNLPFKPSQSSTADGKAFTLTFNGEEKIITEKQEPSSGEKIDNNKKAEMEPERPQIKIEVFVQMEYIGPKAFIKKTVRERDTFQIEGLQRKKIVRNAEIANQILNTPKKTYTPNLETDKSMAHDSHHKQEVLQRNIKDNKGTEAGKLVPNKKQFRQSQHSGNKNKIAIINPLIENEKSPIPESEKSLNTEAPPTDKVDETAEMNGEGQKTNIMLPEESKPLDDVRNKKDPAGPLPQEGDENINAQKDKEPNIVIIISSQNTFKVLNEEQAQKEFPIAINGNNEIKTEVTTCTVKSSRYDREEQPMTETSPTGGMLKINAGDHKSHTGSPVESLPPESLKVTENHYGPEEVVRNTKKTEDQGLKVPTIEEENNNARTKQLRNENHTTVEESSTNKAKDNEDTKEQEHNIVPFGNSKTSEYLEETKKKSQPKENTKAREKRPYDNQPKENFDNEEETAKQAPYIVWGDQDKVDSKEQEEDGANLHMERGRIPTPERESSEDQKILHKGPFAEHRKKDREPEEEEIRFYYIDGRINNNFKSVTKKTHNHCRGLFHRGRNC